MPNKKILKTLIEQNQQEKANQEVEQFLATYIRKSKIQGIDTTTKDFKEKLETMRNKMLDIPENTSEKKLKQINEELSLERIKAKVFIALDEFDTIKEGVNKKLSDFNYTNEEVVRKVDEVIETQNNKKIYWEEVQNKPDIVSQDDYYQEQQKTENNFSLIQVLKNELENVREYFGQLIKGISREIVQLRVRKTNHSELIGITKDQHHKEQHTLESHLTSKLMEELKRLVGGDFTDDLHLHRVMRQEQGKTFGEPWGITKGDLDYYFINNETPTGTVNGVNTDFVLANDIILGSERVFVNGARQFSGAGNDYTISGSTITFATAPPTGSNIICDYTKS